MVTLRIIMTIRVIWTIILIFGQDQQNPIFILCCKHLTEKNTGRQDIAPEMGSGPTKQRLRRQGSLFLRLWHSHAKCDGRGSFTGIKIIQMGFLTYLANTKWTNQQHWKYHQQKPYTWGRKD